MNQELVKKNKTYVSKTPAVFQDFELSVAIQYSLAISLSTVYISKMFFLKKMQH